MVGGGDTFSNALGSTHSVPGSESTGGASRPENVCVEGGMGGRKVDTVRIERLQASFVTQVGCCYTTSWAISRLFLP